MRSGAGSVAAAVEIGRAANGEAYGDEMLLSDQDGVSGGVRLWQ